MQFSFEINMKIKYSGVVTIWKTYISRKITTIYIICFSILSLGEPNNDSPLNTQAATLWSNQGAYKRLLHEKYDAEAKKSSS